MDYCTNRNPLYFGLTKKTRARNKTKCGESSTRNNRDCSLQEMRPLFLEDAASESSYVIYLVWLFYVLDNSKHGCSPSGQIVHHLKITLNLDLVSDANDADLLAAKVDRLLRPARTV